MQENKKKCCLLLVLFFLFETIACIELEIDEGRILGRTYSTAEGNKTCFAFQGIPFAEPPKRFELPVPKAPWNGTLDCTFDKAICVQGNIEVSGSEDCLFLSVFSPNLTGNLPVLFWIHGGTFIAGSASFNSTRPDHFIDNNIVVVEIQYRLGVFGFMSTGDLVLPGNLGLKDQVLALDWTRKNIKYFGGNPDDITITGQSAGAASVGYHLISPKSQGKFRKAIMNSGNPECLWAYNRKAVQTAFAIGATYGVITNDSDNLLCILRGVDYRDLQIKSMAVATTVTIGNILTGIFFGPVIEVPHEEAFFTGEADKQFSTGNFSQVPILTGSLSNEIGGFSNPLSAPVISAALSQVDIQPWNLVPASVSMDGSQRTLVASSIKAKFFNCSLLMAAQLSRAIQFLNVDQFGRATDRLVTNVGQYVNCYAYYFSYTGPLGGVTVRFAPGAQHGEDMPFLFSVNPNVTDNDNLIRKRMTTMWSNFINTGEPTPGLPTQLLPVKWLPSRSNSPFLMKIDLTMGNIIHPDSDYYSFYRNQIMSIGDHNTTY